MVTSQRGTVRSGGPVPSAASWQQAIRNAVRDPRELGRLLCLPSHHVEAAIGGSRDFPLFVPRGYLARMRRGDPHDPLLRQVLPRADETRPAAGFSGDPVGERQAMQQPGLLRKYDGRALIVTTGACAVHCRYCFRRHFPYAQVPKSASARNGTLAAIAADPSLREVILSGGDPLTLADEQLTDFAERLARIPHVQRLRVHTRLPIVIPERVTRELLSWLTGTRLSPVVVLHANHPAELAPVVARAVARLVDAGILVLNQAVLLAGVNDNVAALEGLCQRLIDLRVLPYYLHQLDQVAGAAHFEVPVERGKELIEALRCRLPGYAVPRYVRETAGAPSKVVLA